MSNIRGSTRKLADNIRTAAREAALTPDLRLLAEAVGEIAEQPLKEAGMRPCGAARPTAQPIDAPLLPLPANCSVMPLGELTGTFHSIIGSQARLDSQRIAALAAEQKALANRALNDNVQPEDLMRLERGLLDRLEALVERSPPLRDAGDRKGSTDFPTPGDDAEWPISFANSTRLFVISISKRERNSFTRLRKNKEQLSWRRPA